MVPLRVAIIGGGFGQHVHVPAFRRDPRATVEVLCLSTEARASALAQRLGVPRSSGDWRVVVADPAVDVVAISVPPALQARIAIAAARSGKHILAEKPLAMNSTEAQTIADAVSAARVVAAVDFEFRELPAWQHLRNLVAAGAAGRIRHAYLSWHVESLAHRDPRPNWKRDPAAGGGALNLFAVHSLDAVAWTLGRVDRVAGRLCAPTPEAAESRVDAWLFLRDGTPVSLAICTDATASSEHRFEIYGETGALILENRGGDHANGFSLAVGRRGTPWAPVELPAATEPGGDGRILAVGSLVRRFLDAVVEQRPMTPNLEDGIAAQRAIDAIREAHRTGTWQTLS